jgi:NAD(P)-dependent dehydrogenase (short-subunit alcohol dehydrogenase family)
MRALVPGGNRYIGLSLVHEPARRGHAVTVANSHEVALPEGVERIHAGRRRTRELVAARPTRATTRKPLTRKPRTRKLGAQHG